MIGKTIHELTLGDTAKFSKTIAESDIYIYAGLTGDLNPPHVDETWAKKSHFKTRIAQGLLIAGLVSGILGTKLPGPGTIYLHQDLHFLAPVIIGDTVTASVEVIDIDTVNHRVKLKTICVNDKGSVVLDGHAIVSPPKRL